MRYLFIVQGEGRGHMTQSIALRHHLEQHGHEVGAVLVGKSKGREIPVFFQNKMKGRLATFEEPSFIPTRNKKGVRIIPSILYNLLHIGEIRRQLHVLKRSVDAYEPDVIVNFYSILGGLYFFFSRPTAFKCCIAHQYMFLHPGYQFPRQFFIQRLMLKLLTHITSLNCDSMLALSFYPKEDIPHRKIFVVPPLLRAELFTLKPQNENFLLSYILNDGYRDEIMEWQRQHPKQEIHLFGDAQRGDDLELQPNLFWHALDDRAFLHHLERCSAYASTAGFESICEALYLGKPVLLVPTKGHIEQQCNALDAVRFGAGVSSDSFDLGKLCQAIPNYQPIPQYKKWVQTAPSLFVGHLTDAPTEKSYFCSNGYQSFGNLVPG